MARSSLEPKERRPSAYSEQKIARILAAARTLFTRNGYEITSMDSVAAEAKVSKATVYAHFISKSDLFAAVIANEAETHVVSLTAADDEPVEIVLERFGREAFELLLTPTNTAMFRMIAAESTRFPEIGPIFFAAGPAQLQNDLAAFLSAAMQRGVLRSLRPDLAARQFLALICGDLQVREILALPPDGANSPAEVLRCGIDTFLRAFAIAPAMPPIG